MNKEIEIILDENFRKRAIDKCNEIISSLEDFSIKERAFVLIQLNNSFKDVTGIDVCKFIEISEVNHETN